MGGTNSRKKPRKAPDDYRWELVEIFRARAGRSADVLRALLFALSSGAVYFLVNKNYGQIGIHWVAITLFLLSMMVLIFSWDRQKKKSIERFVALRDFGFERYYELEDEIKENIFLRNDIIDRVAMGLIASGFFVEFCIFYFLAPEIAQKC